MGRYRVERNDPGTADWHTIRETNGYPAAEAISQIYSGDCDTRIFDTETGRIISMRSVTERLGIRHTKH